ncbi:hypothetical protein L798_04111 [Zootermopsis nevadensis]|uniref:Uncharacterized protein n=1 Tax=Zootermopsis nevadensis TaxID=136037 RepID=A0A067QQJ9_ZOONE|nr:hypothetical protein L798_04111 [Zootermopsis nevadensis]
MKQIKRNNIFFPGRGITSLVTSCGQSQEHLQLTACHTGQTLSHSEMCWPPHYEADSYQRNVIAADISTILLHSVEHPTHITRHPHLTRSHDSYLSCYHTCNTITTTEQAPVNGLNNRKLHHLSRGTQNLHSSSPCMHSATGRPTIGDTSGLLSDVSLSSVGALLL